MKSICDQFATILVVLLAGLIVSASLPAQAAAANGVVNINTATVKQLQYLKGIGAKKAQEIVNKRSVKPFNSIEELTKIKGIGLKTVNRLRPQLTLQGETTLKPPAKKRRSKRKGS